MTELEEGPNHLIIASFLSCFLPNNTWQQGTLPGHRFSRTLFDTMKTTGFNLISAAKVGCNQASHKIPLCAQPLCHPAPWLSPPPYVFAVNLSPNYFVSIAPLPPPLSPASCIFPNCLRATRHDLPDIRPPPDHNPPLHCSTRGCPSLSLPPPSDQPIMCPGKLFR